MDQTRKHSAWISFAIILAMVLIPYGMAAANGTPDPELGGLAALHSRAEAVYCEDGLTSTGMILMAQIVLVGGAALAARWREFGAVGDVFRRQGGYLFASAILIAIPFILAWQTDSSVCTRGKAFFWESIFIEVFILSILAISYNLLFGFTGIISFGHAVFFGTGAYMVGILIKHLEWSWWAAVIGTLLISVLIALIQGVVGLRIKGLYFALFTLAFAEVFFLLAGNRILVDITGAEDGFTFTVPDFLNATRNRFFFYYMTLFFLVVAFLIVRRLMDSPTGQVLRGLRDNEARTQMIGYNPFIFKLVALVIAGMMATSAGILRGFVLKGASPNVLGLGFTFDPLLATIIGGIGTFAGPVLGAFGLHLIEQALRDTVLTIGATEVNIGERWALILGLLFILIVIVFPKGVVGTIQDWRMRGFRKN
jgi:branched-chain amino acid transport system permease protein